jgi:hypothetical protein
LYAWECSGIKHASGYSLNSSLDELFATFNKLTIDNLVTVKERVDTIAGASKVDVAINKSLGSYITYRKYLERHSMIDDTVSREIYLGKRMCDAKLIATFDDIRIQKDQRRTYLKFINKLKTKADGKSISFVKIEDAAYCNKPNAGCYPRIEFAAGDKTIRCLWPIIFIDNKWKFFHSPDIK